MSGPPDTITFGWDAEGDQPARKLRYSYAELIAAIPKAMAEHFDCEDNSKWSLDGEPVTPEVIKGLLVRLGPQCSECLCQAAKYLWEETLALCEEED